MARFNRKVTFELIVSSRTFFNSAYLPAAREALTAACDKLVQSIAPPQPFQC